MNHEDDIMIKRCLPYDQPQNIQQQQQPISATVISML